MTEKQFLEKRVRAWILKHWHDSKFRSRDFLDALHAEFGGVVVQRGDPSLSAIGRNALRVITDHGRRQFRSATLLNENGKEERVWVQPKFSEFDEAVAVVKGIASNAMRNIKRANIVALDYQAWGQPVQLPFPEFVERDDTGSGE